MDKAIFVLWKHPFNKSNSEMKSLCKVANLDIVHEITFRRLKPHPRYFLPEKKLDELQEFFTKEAEYKIVIDGQILPPQHARLEKKFDCEIFDKVTLILLIFENKAKSHFVQLQIELAKQVYLAPYMLSKISQNVSSEKQARERGRGEQITHYSKSAHASKVAKLKKQIKLQLVDSGISSSSDKIPRIPIIGFYSAGKSTLFNILTDSTQATHEDAFTTMFTKVTRSKKLGYPLDFIDTIGLVNLPFNVLNAFQRMLIPFFSSLVLLVVLDSTLLLAKLEEQITHILLLITKFTRKDSPKIIFILTKMDLNECKICKGVRRFLIEDKTVNIYRLICVRKDKPDSIISKLEKTVQELLWNSFNKFDLKSINASQMSKIRNFAKVEIITWNKDGTCNIEGKIFYSLMQSFGDYLQTNEL